MTNLKASTLRPGLLVSLNTHLRGGVKYFKQGFAEEVTADGAEEATWNTRRTTEDPIEHDKATKVRNEASSLIRKVCAVSKFGLLCPDDRSGDLYRAVAEAQTVVDAFNATATITQVELCIFVGRVASDDVEAVRKINGEVRALLETMERGIANLDVNSVRKAVADAKKLGSMLSPDAAARVRIAVDAAREAARKIKKAGEQAAQEINRSAISRIAESRTAFLDLDPEQDVLVPTEEARVLDLTPTEPVEQTDLEALGSVVPRRLMEVD